jgi:hypothetical protein
MRLVGVRAESLAPVFLVLGVVSGEKVLIINREMERMIRACPAQYLWGYNRYKRPAGAPPRPGVDAS